MGNDKLTSDINNWLCKLPRKEFEYVLLLRDKEAERSERLHANTIASLTGEVERLRGILRSVTPDPVWGEDPHTKAYYREARAALQPKEGV